MSGNLYDRWNYGDYELPVKELASDTDVPRIKPVALPSWITTTEETGE